MSGMFSFGDTLEITDLVVLFVFVDVVDIPRVGDLSVVVSPDISVKKTSFPVCSGIVPTWLEGILDSVKDDER